MSTRTSSQDGMFGAPLIDHHCHGVMARPLQRAEFEDLATESSWPGPAGTTFFDTQLGFAIRRWCAPVLGLEAHVSPEDYLARRAELGADAVNSLLLSAANLDTVLVETGYRGEEITSPEQTGLLASAGFREVVRLERIAEDVAAAGTTPGTFATDFAAALEERSRNAAGVKSIMAYRYGLDFNPDRPSDQEVQTAAAQWLAAAGNEPRMDHPVLLRHLLWAAVDLGKPIQFHVGYGDADVDLHRCNPLNMTAWLRAVRSRNVPVMLLHCYPFQREAGYLAHVFPHVYADVGLAVNYTGSRSDAVIAESLELTPFHKAVFSTDAFGLPELYFLGAHLFRRGFDRVVGRWVEDGEWSPADAERVAHLIGHVNSERAYGLEPR
ncbi:amidohydrolase family protein [Arthrobacter sp. BL-252-APC-1A]|uniref:amidohydrolase family protein n=1 Tax=Arthrobacter sp. BL-252-APC-1A TaxID=2606622 RepID=UPI002DDA18DA|nr:amidohydrolase family protein [Arthrobacter sp. BL-252-APC-1A]